MCYSAQIWADYRQYVRLFGAHMDIREFVQLFLRRGMEGKLKVPKAMEAAFDEPQSPEEQQVRSLIEAYRIEQATALEQEVFKQRTRLVEAERKLATKPTKAAAEHQRIATDKIAWAMEKLAGLRSTELVPDDARIFPGHYAPVMVMENGQRVIKPMRYQCRPAGKPAFFDTKFPGTYNARRDNLRGFWKDLYGVHHGVMVVNAFYENVNRHKTEGRELGPDEAVENVVLEFRPRPAQDMLIACLWSRWTAPGQSELLSFAAITDEPPPEVAAAGHDRCIVQIKPEHLDAWLDPGRSTIEAMDAILDDRARPFYEHRLAA